MDVASDPVCHRYPHNIYPTFLPPVSCQSLRPITAIISVYLENWVTGQTCL